MKKTVCFMALCLILGCGGYGTYATMYRNAKFEIQTLQGNAALLNDIDIQLKYRANNDYVDVTFHHQTSSYQIKDQQTAIDINKVFETTAYEEEDAEEWIDLPGESDTCYNRYRNLHQKKLQYDILLDNAKYSYLMDTGLMDVSNDNYTLRVFSEECGEEGMFRIDRYVKEEGNLDLSTTHLLAKYSNQIYYFVPHTTPYMKGDRYLYQLTIDDGSIHQEKIAKLDQGDEILGCFLVAQRILVLSLRGNQMHVVQYDSAGKELKSSDIKVNQGEPLGYASNDQYLIWKSEDQVHVFDCEQMKLVAEEQLSENEEDLYVNANLALFYKNGILWTGSIQLEDTGSIYASFHARKQNELLYQGKVEFQSGKKQTETYLVGIAFK